MSSLCDGWAPNTLRWWLQIFMLVRSIKHAFEWAHTPSPLSGMDYEWNTIYVYIGVRNTILHYYMRSAGGKSSTDWWLICAPCSRCIKVKMCFGRISIKLWIGNIQFEWHGNKWHNLHVFNVNFWLWRALRINCVVRTLCVLLAHCISWR